MDCSGIDVGNMHTPDFMSGPLREHVGVAMRIHSTIQSNLRDAITGRTWSCVGPLCVESGVRSFAFGIGCGFGLGVGIGYPCTGAGTSTNKNTSLLFLN